MATKKKAKSKSPASAADAVDEQLERYRSMRDFDVTAEPSGEEESKKTSKNRAAQGSGLPFVIQKHAATRLHYDFRLGWNGVLKSWAVAKGPSYFTGDKRLAVQVEDHPMEYGGFEGIIPKGQYGGGTVMVWDQGTWEPQAGYNDVDEGLRTGSLKFIMHGTKMKGKWALIRMGGKAANESKPNWLLIKEHDEFERKQDDAAVTEEEPNSVVTGRSLEEIASNEDHVWNSKETARGDAWYRKEAGVEVPKKADVEAATINEAEAPRKSKKITDELKVPVGAPKEKLPEFIKPELALQATTAPSGAGWLHELKLDGYRIQGRKDGDKVQLLTRTGLDWTHRMKTIAALVGELPVERAVLDGEVVVLAENGTTSFADLQAAFQEGVKKPLSYFIFDLLHLNGHNLRGLPLIERKRLLAKLLEDSGEFVRLSEHLETDGAVVFRKACEMHTEGIISKRTASKYSSGRGGSWLKLKCVHEQEFVIGGFTLPSNGTHGVGALLLGYYDDKKLVYSGRTGTGFTQKTHRVLRNQLEELRQKENPFESPPAEARRGAIWVKPDLVAQVNFATWTADNLVRQASFKGLREDKPASEVRREEPTVAPRARGAKNASHHASAPIAAKTESGEEDAAKAAPVKAAKKSAKLTLENAPVRLTHPEKVLDAETQLTKQQLADYYWAIASHMLPHIEGRPVSLVRCPDGSEKPCFYQKHVNAMLPPGITSVDVPDKKTGKIEPYITLSTAEALAGLAQMGVLEVHPWGSRNEDLEHPDRIIIDLDPDAAIAWPRLAESAGEVRKELKKLGLESFLKSTGGKGLHVVIPFVPEYDWAVIKQFAHAFVLKMEKDQPGLYLTKMSKAARKDRIFLDYLRNERGATAVAAFSPRARAGAAVSLPLDWGDLTAATRTVVRVADFVEWQGQLKRDPWKEFLKLRQRITAKMLETLKISPAA
ncbi:DNA ligase D [Tunturiibacter gelidoferens]|jgi:bifunctional non-homologous end joining protein LigD|uniref:DNA ligase (ATP) n=1 Tax=Tunturiibacter gelidiferens TaxID=3069689 RepID=A0A9X0QC80_9BACT|nr:DNA ligase D [Edaphobacter lichenicola]MBB5327689.1 bifunctional non-homologous end joining protein LigD [Edaphobacter lichenicola]